MTTYSKAVTSVSAGATASTFDSVGDITLRNDAKRTWGIYVGAAPVTSEAAVAYHGVIRVGSNDLGISGQIASCPPYEGGAPATNIGFRAYASEYIPFNWTCDGKETIKLEFSSQLPDPTNACSVVAAMVYEAGLTPSSQDALGMLPDLAPFVTRGFQQISKAATTAAGETSIGDVIIPGWATEIVGFKQYVLPNLMTAGEEVVGFARYKSTMPDFDPVEIPFGVMFGAPLGTPVGKGGEVQIMRAFPWSFKKTKKTAETLSCYCVLNVAITTGHPASMTVYYR